MSVPIRQMLVACFCVLLGLQQTIAVVNNGQNKENVIDTATLNNTETKDGVNSNSSVPDSIAESSETVRREAPLNLGEPAIQDASGLVAPDSYEQSISTNLNLPAPVYGVPEAPLNNLVYPQLSPDIAPPVQVLPIKDIYGPPLPISLPPLKYGPPILTNPLPKPINFPKPIYGPPQILKPVYGPPQFLKPHYGHPKIPKSIYGPPFKLSKPFISKPLLLPGLSKPFNTYGPPSGYINLPKDHYGPPKGIYGPPKPIYGPPALGLQGPLSFQALPHPIQGPSAVSVQIHSTADSLNIDPPVHYGPPEPDADPRPPHPGAPAPPTPPEIKYDGWQPILGLTSHPPNNVHKEESVVNNDLHVNVDLVPPTEGSSSGDSYGAPLNSITGSGGVVSSSGDDLRGNEIPHNDNYIVKSVSLELNPNSVNNGPLLADSYTAPPLNSYSPNGPYAASQSFNKPNDVLLLPSLDNFANSLASSFDTTLSGPTLSGPSLSGPPLSGPLLSGPPINHNNNLGLIPSSGIYGIPPSGKYGTPLLQAPFRPRPKHPILLREPVPQGLLQSIGRHVSQKDAHGIIDNLHQYAGPAYVPPPVPEIASSQKPRLYQPPPLPSNLYSLPNKSPLSFQQYVHGSPNIGLNPNINSFNLHGPPVGLGGPQYPIAQPSNNYPTIYPGYGGPFYPCSHKGPLLGIPPNGPYNLIGNGFPASPLGVGINDLQASHSQTSSSVSEPSQNSVADKEKIVNNETKIILPQNSTRNEEVVTSQNVDLSNINLQGALGSYNVQIQPSVGSDGSPQHKQIIDEGLLQSILNAIEQQPQQQQQLPQALLYQQPPPPQIPERTFIQPHFAIDSSLIGLVPPQFNALPHYDAAMYGINLDDSRSQNPIFKEIVISPNSLKENSEEKESSSSPGIVETVDVPQIDNNEIAIYFNRSSDLLSGEKSESRSNKNTVTDNSREKIIEIRPDFNANVRNGQQYGSYVSFKSGILNYEYGDLDEFGKSKSRSRETIQHKT